MPSIDRSIVRPRLARARDAAPHNAPLDPPSRAPRSMTPASSERRPTDPSSAALALERARANHLEEELRKVRASAEKLAQTVEAEEEFLVQALNRKLEAANQEREILARDAQKREGELVEHLERRLRRLQDEKCALENALEREQERMMHRLTTAIEELGREKTQVAKERDRLSKDLEQKSSETMRLKEEKVRLENTLESEEEHIVNLMQSQILVLLKRNRSLERQVKVLGGAVSDSEYVSDDQLGSPRRGSFGRDGFRRDPFARQPGSSMTSPFASDRESLSPGRRQMQQSASHAGSSAPPSARSTSSEPRSPRTS